MPAFNRETLIPDLERLRSSLDQDRQSWIEDCRNIAKLFYSKQSRALEDTKSQQIERKSRLNNRAMSSLPILSLRDMAAGLQSGLVSPGKQWFRRGLTDTQAEKSSQVRQWLDEVTKIELQILDRSNFYENVYQLLKSTGAFGSGVMFVLPDKDKHIRFKTLEVGTYYLSENNAGVIDTCVRELKLTARQIFEEFGEDKLSPTIRQAYDDPGRRDITRFEVINTVLPNDSVSVSLPFRFLDIYYLPSEPEIRQSLLRFHGFDEKPFGAPRWEPEGIYGTSPAIDVYSDVQSLQSMEKEALRIVHLKGRPPMIGDSSLSIVPGALNPDFSGNTAAIRPVFDTTRLDLQPLQFKIDELKQTIRSGMYVDLFQAILTSPRANMTATEVEARRQEGLFSLGTAIDRLNTEGFTPIMDRVFSILFQEGLLPDPPPELAGQELKVEYTSVLAQAQKTGNLVSIERFIAFLQGAAQTYPAILDNLNFDEVAKEYGESIPAKLLNDDKTIEAIREQRREQQALALQAQASEQGAKNIKTLAEADAQDSDIVEQITGA